MKETFIFTCEINETNGKRRVSEYRYSVTVDGDGNVKLNGCCGHIYPTEVVKIPCDYKLYATNGDSA